MNVVFLSPHFPPHYANFCLRLREAGATVLGIGDAATEDLSPRLRGGLSDYYRVDDMHEYDALVRACGHYTHKYGRLDRFESLNEYWLGTEARIREDFNIFGIRTDGIDSIRRKSRMKEKFREAGIPVAWGRVIRTRGDARKLVDETGYPIVAKPDAGVGALDTFKIHDDGELDAFFRQKPDMDYIAEEFISGQIVSFDGLADGSGHILFCTSHVFSQGIMETVNQGRHIAYYSLREIPPELEATGRACVETFGVRERFFHIEFFRTAAGRHVALEVNMRPPGGFTTDMFNYACDIDIYRVWAALLARGERQLTYARKYFCCYASRRNRYAYRYDHDEILDRYGRYMVQVESVPGVFSAALGDVGYIFRAEDAGMIHRITDFIHETQTG
jgi:predicted ATP-grasp superfamily ATP-dependent carboligase